MNNKKVVEKYKMKKKILEKMKILIFFCLNFDNRSFGVFSFICYDFCNVIGKEKDVIENSNVIVLNHFVCSDKMLILVQVQKDYKLLRYACYLIAQNTNPR